MTIGESEWRFTIKPEGDIVKRAIYKIISVDLNSLVFVR